eukprot:scaffold47992_cov60-Phaeocystis_antarctica.AAC.2
MHLVDDLDTGARLAAARHEHVHKEVLLDAVLLGDIHAPLDDSAGAAAGDGDAAHRHAAQAGPLDGGTPDAGAGAVELAAAAAAAVLDRAAAADVRFPVCCCRHLTNRVRATDELIGCGHRNEVLARLSPSKSRRDQQASSIRICRG